MRIPRMFKLIKYPWDLTPYIANGVLKMLPFDMRNTIHMLFTVMWATGITPKD